MSLRSKAGIVGFGELPSVRFLPGRATKSLLAQVSGISQRARKWVPVGEEAGREGDGERPPKYYASSDAERLVPIFLRKEWNGILVAGDPGRNQARGYTNNHEQGAPVSNRVNLPGHWNKLIRG